MSEGATRVILFVIVLAIAIYWASRPASEPAEEAVAPLTLEKGVYLGPPDVPLSETQRGELRRRARTDFAPRL